MLAPLVIGLLLLTGTAHNTLGRTPDATEAVGGAAIGSLLFGWRGIPWGPIQTVRAIVTNLRGGTRETVAEHLGRVRSTLPAELDVRVPA